LGISGASMMALTAKSAIFAAILALASSNQLNAAPKSKGSQATRASETAPAQPATPTPKLIVVISVDQFSADLFAEYRGKATGGLKRLQQGVVFPSGYQSHAATETCPGHSTILTGTRPARNGIIANNWSDPNATRTGKDGRIDYGVYCAEDETVPGSTSSQYTVSATHLKSATLGDLLKTRSAQSRVVSIAGKDRAAVMMGGHAIDQAYWYDNGKFVTFKGSKTRPPEILASVNAAAANAIASPAPVALLPGCKSYSITVPLSSGGSIGTLQPRKAGDAKALRAAAVLDRLTLDLAIGTMNEMQLGKGPNVDILSVGLSATDYVGHTFGTSGAEMCQQVLAVDSMLGGFIAKLDALKAPYVIALTADHGGHDAPERNKIHAAPDAKRISGQTLPQINKAIATKHGLIAMPLIGDGVFGEIYLTKDVPSDKRDAVLADASAILTAHPDVSVVFSKTQLAAQPIPSGPPENFTLIERARASFDASRSGDLLVVLKPRVTPIPNPGFGYVATHGSIWDYDRRVPILFWWPNVNGFEQPLGVETVDIMPTLASLIGLTLADGSIDGKCLDLDVRSSSNCP
jgi:predicted AlkP superfamily pyrophosphatase or phosphodiesterase